MSKNNVQLFNFDDHLVRAVEINGEPWFIGKDICRVLTIVNHNDALSSLDDDERGFANTDPLGNSLAGGGAQETVIISEAGVYRLVFRSRKPEAERFKRWLAHEVLPQIRRTGRYVPENEPEPFIFNAEPLNAMQGRVAFIREARQLFGVAKARKLWAMAGFPTVAGEEPEERPRTSKEEDGKMCLEHLLSANLGGHIVLDLIREGDGSANSRLAKAGIRVLDDGGIAVATAAEFVAPIFARSKWMNGGHRNALLMLEGTFRWKNMKFYCAAAKTIYIPETLLTAEMAA